LAELDLNLKFSLETHIHADHITGSGALRRATGAQTGASSSVGSAAYDLALEEGQRLIFGDSTLEVRATPGHTDGCLTFVARDGEQTFAFTGDALLIRGCGRTDFQQGSAAALYRSVHQQIYSLPGDTVIYPGHDYRGHSASSVAEEMAHNPRLNRGVDLPTFAGIMDELNLVAPKRVAEAVPANMACGTEVGSIRTLTPSSILDLGRFRLIDVRDAEEYDGELGHIVGSELVPLATIAEYAGNWPTTDPMLLVCRSGVRAEKACNVLRERGFVNVTNLAGGMLAWNDAQTAAVGGER
jgi:sulfur dioxygenase